jgi:hypothetical protein
MNTKLAFYTCFIGDISNTSFIIPPLPSTKYDCYYLTNNNEMIGILLNTGWKIVFVDIPITYDYNQDCMNCKIIRACPHKFDALNKYDYLCWFDSKLKVDCEKVEKLIEEMEILEKLIVLSKHPYQFPDVWGEYYEAIKYPRYAFERDKYKTYIEEKIAERGTDKLNVHYCGGFSIRKINNPEVIKYNEEWFQNILKCGIEDQISLQFVHQNYTNLILSIEYKACWDYNY